MKELKLIDYIKSRDFDQIQIEIGFWDSKFEDFQDELGKSFDGIMELRDIFLIQKEFYDATGVYIIFPIVAKFVHEQATDRDCTWCGVYDKSQFEPYLLKLIQEYEDNQNNTEY